ncbi:MAG: NAD(P)-binding domain-containing protein [Smithella sp.]
MSFELISQFLGDSSIGLFGAGYLGRAIAKGLLEAGLPRRNLAICHRGSEATDRELADAGLADLVAGSQKVVLQSRILLYLVRPQNYQAIRDYDLRGNSLFISFLAGVPLSNLPIHIPDSQRVRVMTSAPDTFRRHNGIAALYPADNPLAREMLVSLGLRVVPLGQESDIHAFTALGPCLPIVLTYWESAGCNIDDQELLETAKKYGLSDYAPILRWAHSIRPGQLSPEEIEHYLAQATTPGGITDAILSAMSAGMSLSAALQRGIERSKELAVS